MERNQNEENPVPQGGRIVFGIIMILVYVGVGLLFIFNVFPSISNVVSYVIGGLLCAYGVWRAVRLIKGWG